MDGEQSVREAAANHELIALVNQARQIASTLTDVASEAAAKEASADEALAKIEATVRSAYAKSEEATAAFDVAQEKLADLKTAADGGIAALNQATSEAAAASQAMVAELTAASTTAQSAANAALSELAQKVQTKISEIETAAQQATSKSAEAVVAANSATEHQARAKQLALEVESTKTEVLAHHSVTANAVASKERFEQTSAAALQNFDATFETAKTKYAVFETACAKAEEKIAELTGQAEAMLFGATNAGIASAFKDEVRALDKLIARSTVMFLVGIVLLCVSLIPLFMYMTNVAEGHELTFASVLARSVILVPAGWLTLHYARRIAANFDLRQQYVHKYSLAATVEPFRRQGGDHASAAVSGVLEELMKNPASSVARRHKKMGDGPGEAVQDVVQPLTRLIADQSRGQ